ncbi:MAG TPA: hypothetical protein VGK32_04910 [Vicinamibacterales bacterium]|jgi:hypothetical protein
MLVHVNELVLVGTVHADLDGFSRLATVLQALQPSIIAVETSAARAKLFEGQFDFDPDSIYRDAQERYVRTAEKYLADPAAFEAAKQRYAGLPVDWAVKHIAAMEAGAHLLNACYGFELKVAMKYAERHPRTEVCHIDLPEENIDPIRQAISPEAGRPPIQNLRFFAGNQPALDYGLRGFVALLRALQDGYYDESGGVLRERYEENVANWDRFPVNDHYRRAVYDPRREPYMTEQIKVLRHRKPQDRCVAIVGATHLTGISRLLDGYRHSSISLFDVDVLCELAA